MLAIADGLVLAVVVDPLIGALHGPFPRLWLALAAEVAVAALSYAWGTRPRAARWRNRDQHLEPFIVQTAWLVGALAALLISARRLGQTPAQ